MEKNELDLPDELVCDRGRKGEKEINGVKIITPNNPKASDPAYQKQQKRKNFRSMAATVWNFKKMMDMK